MESLSSGSGLSGFCGTLYNPVPQRRRIQWPELRRTVKNLSEGAGCGG